MDSEFERRLHLRPPFRADHVGSLLRPPYLYEKRALYEQGKCTKEDLKNVEEAAIKEAIRFLQDVGIRTITDGEFTRGMFFEGVFDRLEGMTHIPQRPIGEWKRYIPHIKAMYEQGVPASDTFFCSGKISRTRPFYVDQFKSLAALVAPEDVKLIKIDMCSPSWFHQRHGSDMTYDPQVYKNDDEYFDDLGVAYRSEIRELYDLGCRHIQIDDPTFCYFCNDAMIADMEEAGVDHNILLDTYIRAINIITKGRPQDLTISLHMCRGNFMGHHFSQGGYGKIAEKVFNNLDVDSFYLEYDTERSGDFAPLRYMPVDKTVVLGLVSSKTSQQESLETLKCRVYEAVDALCSGFPHRSKEAALNQICISPQCGFASVWQGNPLTQEDQRRKFELLVETARQIWPDC